MTKLLLGVNMLENIHHVVITLCCLTLAQTDHHTRDVINVFFDTSSRGHLVDKDFLSFSQDGSIFVSHWHDFNTSSIRFQTLARGLSPVVLRVGGRETDRILFVNRERCFSEITADDFDRLYEFCRAVGWKLSMNLNLQYRNGGQWNSSNAKMLMDYAVDRGYTLEFGLGYEPDKYPSPQESTPEQIGRDFGHLRTIMNTYPAFRNRRLIGPSVSQTFPRKYMIDFLMVGAPVIDAVSIIHNHGSATELTPGRMVDPYVLGSIVDTIDKTRRLMHENGGQGLDLWLEDSNLTRSPNTSGYIGGFMWLDTLGKAASTGVSVVTKRSFSDMFDEKEIPTPEYWISLLFKRLVGRQVLNVFTDGNVEFRIYGHCSFNTPSGLVVYYINLHKRDIGWQLARVRGENYELYSLTPGEDGKLSSRSVKLNGQKLRMTGDNLPSLHPVRSRTWPIIVPSLSYGFLVLPNVSVLACQ